MSTIKDVAKLAGVSIGTVSNVINGKTRNMELIARVEDAIDLLGYKPDAAARSLIQSSSNIIGVILPHVQLKEYSSLLNELENIFSQRGYQLFVQFSHNNKIRERNCLAHCQERKAAGCILFTEQSLGLEKKSCGDAPLLLITRHSLGGCPGDRIVLDYVPAFQKAVAYYREKVNPCPPGLLLGQDLSCGQGILESYLAVYPDKDKVKIIDYKKETAFRTAFQMIAETPLLRSFIAGNYEQAQGIIKAFQTLGITDFSVTAVKESSWMEDEGTFSAQISVSMAEVALRAALRLLEAIESPNIHEPLTEKVTAHFEKTRFVVEGMAQTKERLKFLMFDCPAGKSLKMLSEIYENKTGLHIDFTFLDYDGLEQYMGSLPQSKDTLYDGFMTDIAWLEELGSRKCFADLSQDMSEEPEYFQGFIEGTLKQHGIYEGKLIALPFMSGCQFLFYQEDLFTSPVYRMQFERQYGCPLKPPQTWKELNMTAEFFTEAYNPKSPVPYGISMVTGENVYMAISFLNCLLSYGCTAIDENGEVAIHNSNSVKALESFLKSYEYTSGMPFTNWSQAAEEFMSGKSAMMIAYDSHATDINDITKSAVAGNVGVALVPGKTPVLGGWSLALNGYKDVPEEAKRFILWACSEQTALLYSLLGGTSLRKSVYLRQELENLYPWSALVLENYRRLKRRYEKQQDGSWGRNNYAFHLIISSEISRAKAKEITPEQALKNIELELRRLQSHKLNHPDH